MDLQEYSFDYIWIARELQSRSSILRIDPFDDAVIRFLLLEWGASIAQTEAAYDLFLQKSLSNSLGDFSKTLNRLMGVVNESDFHKEHLIRDLAVILQIQRSEYTAEQQEFLFAFQNLLDMKPSRFQLALSSGTQMASSLLFLSQMYVQSDRSNSVKQPG